MLLSLNDEAAYSTTLGFTPVQAVIGYQIGLFQDHCSGNVPNTDLRV